MKIIFIGGGNITNAIVGALDPMVMQIIITQRNSVKLQTLSLKYPQMKIIPKLNFEVTKSDILFLAVKPKDAEAACQEIQPYVQNTTIVSVISGVTCATLTTWLNNKHIIRAMPNAASQVQSSCTGVYIPSDITDIQKNIVLNILSVIGKNYIFQDEAQINKMIAVAGSAPAYILYFMESMIETAINQFGFSPTDALNITSEVVQGCVELIKTQPNTSIAQLRSTITPPQGTTAAAMDVFQKQRIAQIIQEAELACYARAQELGNLYSGQK